MRVVVQDTLKNTRTVPYKGQAGFRIGRDASCEICLDSTMVSKQHAQVDRSSAGWEIRVAPEARPLRVDDQWVEGGKTTALRDGSEIHVAQYVLIFEAEAGDEVAAKGGAEDVNRVQQDLHTAVIRQLDLRRAAATGLEHSSKSLEQINAIIDELLRAEFKGRVLDDRAVRNKLLSMDLRRRLVLRLGGSREIEGGSTIEKLPGENTALEAVAEQTVDRVVRQLGLKLEKNTVSADMEIVDKQYNALMERMVNELTENVQIYVVTRYLKKVLHDMIFGLGPLQDLLDTPNISEIMIVSPDLVYVERGGQIVESDSKFLGDEALLNVIERIVAPLGRRIDRSSPLVDARLKDGSRVNAVIPPIALKGPCLTIRRFPAHRVTVGDLVKWGSMPSGAAALLDAAVKMPKNVVVAGGTGSGKTTMLNCLSAMIPDDDRIVTIEDAAELQLQQEHVVSLETKPANVEGKGAYTIRDLVKNALRMRPDRIVVGECRGEEAFDMLQAMNTGHDGSMTTIHSNSAQDAISRIETMVLMAADLPLQAVRRQIGQAVDIIVFVGRLKNGRRMTIQITEVLGLNPQTGEVDTRDVFRKVGEGADAILAPTGYMPSFLGEAVERGLLDVDNWFGGAA